MLEQVASLGILSLIVDMQEFSTHHCFALRASVVELQLRLLHTHGRVFQLSFINFHVDQSNNTTSQSVELAGHNTSQAHSQSLPSHTLKHEHVPSVSSIVTVVTFHALLLVTQAIQFHAGQVSHCTHWLHVSHFGITKFNTAALEVQELVTHAQVQAAHVVVDHTETVAAVPVSHFAHFGIIKSDIATLELQELVTLASVHGSHVQVVQTAIVAASHGSHLHP